MFFQELERGGISSELPFRAAAKCGAPLARYVCIAADTQRQFDASCRLTTIPTPLFLSSGNCEEVRMPRLLTAGLTALFISTSSFAYAQTPSTMGPKGGPTP